MNANALIDVCRTCPRDEQLLSVFNTELAAKYNMKEVVLLTTGVEILESDLVSKKICQRCCSITLKMFQFRQDALKQDRELKEMLSRYVENQGILTACKSGHVLIEGEDDESCPPCKVPNIEQNRPLTTNEDLKKNFHPTVAAIYDSYPNLKLPKKCFDRHVAPVVSLTMGDVESYFKKQKLDMEDFVDKLYSKNEPSNQVAKKKTSVPTKNITVTPLKISKKAIETMEQPGSRKRKRSSTDSDKGNNNYGSTILQKKRGRPKKSLSNADNGQTLNLANKNSKLRSQPSLKSVRKNSKPKILKGNIIPEKELIKCGVIKDSLAPEDSTALSLSFSAIPSQSDTTFLNEESSYISKPISSSGISKPESIESLGLSPCTFTTKSETLITCNVCGSVHKNAAELKWHNRNHMVCQFCKRRFKSIEKKVNHVDSFCKIKRIMNFSSPIVALESIHLNLEVRKKYINAFSSFDSIPGLVEPAPLEHLILEAASIAADGVIVLSDNEEYGADPSDPLSDIPTPSANMPSPADEKEIYKYVAEMRPDIKIKNNRVVNRLASGKSDKEVIKDLIAFVKPEQATCEQELQTDLPNSRDIKVNNYEGTCKFKYLSEKLLTYKIPIKVSYGTFNASYQFINDSKPNKMMALWDDLPIIDYYKSSVRKPTSGGNKRVAHHNVPRQHLPLNTLPASPINVLNLNVTSTATPFAGSSPPVTVSSTKFPAASPQYFTPPLFSPTRKIESVANQSISPINLVVNKEVPRTSNNVLNQVIASTDVASPLPAASNAVPLVPKTTFNKNPSVLSRSSNYNYSDPRSPVSVNVVPTHSFNSVGGYSALGTGNIVTGHLPHADAVHNSQGHNNMVLSAPVIHRPPAKSSLVRGSIFTKNTESCLTNLPVSNACSTIPSSNHTKIKFRIKDVSELQ